ncbi:MAG: AsmA family protein [Roseococcus sp.]|nr:AsmA family protein [Roseococcus sp.]
MRRRGLLLGLLAALGGAVAAAAWLLPPWLDWDRHRITLAAIASERLGRPVALTGPVQLVLLPQPRIEAERVLIGEAEDDIRMAARGLRLRLGLGALLAGRIEVRELALLGADIRLPWPPDALPGLVPPRWLTELDARIEDSRILIGGAVVEGVTARLTAGGASEALTAEGRLSWRGRPMRFQAVLGRAADDGVGALDFTGEAEGATLRARGALLPQGGFEGRLEAEGPSLAALMPAPPGAFRARAELAAGAERLVARHMILDFGGQAVRGAASLALLPEPEFRLALAAPRLDVEPWLAALRGAGAPAIPTAIEFAAEQATLGALPLRRLAAAARVSGEALSIAEARAELPGGTEVALSGGGTAGRLELRVRLRAQDAVALAESLALPPALRPEGGTAEAQFHLMVEGPQFAVSALEARWGGSRATGGLTWRAGPRPALAAGLELDALTSPAAPPEWLAALREAGQGLDLQLRLGIGRLLLGEAGFERVSLDLGLEEGRLILRRGAARHLGLDLVAAGTLAAGRLHELSLEGEGAAGPLLARLGLAAPGLAAQPLRLRLTGGGPLEALALRLEAELAEARIEAQGVLDSGQRRGAGNLTLRHPGAARFLAALGAAPPPDWLGPGSLSLVAALSHRPGRWALESGEWVAGGLRGGGQMLLALEGARPALSGRLAFERLPLPGLAALPLASPLDLDLALAAERVEIEGLPALSRLAATLRADAAAWRLIEARAGLAGGEVQGALTVAQGPRLALEGQARDLLLSGPLLGTPLDFSAGRLSGGVRLRAEGATPAEWRASLAGDATLSLRDAVLTGLDAPAAAAALDLAEPEALRAALAAALAGGATPIERGEARLDLDAGLLRLAEARLMAEGGLALGLSGRVALAEGLLALRVELPGPPGAPALGLLLEGPLAAPRRRAEPDAFLDWRAQNPR